MIRSFTLPAGTFYIGDPCWVFPHAGPLSTKWNELLDSCDYFSSATFAELPPNIKVWAYPTQRGAGAYCSNIGSGFYVETGLLGIIPIKTVKFLNVDFNFVKNVGLIHKFEKPFKVTFTDHGRFYFDWICISATHEKEEYPEDSSFEEDDVIFVEEK